jgi:hypothetical protein
MELDLIMNVIRRSVAPLHLVSTSKLCIVQRLLFTLSSLSPRLNQLSLLLPTLDSMTPEFGSVVDLTQSLGSPLSDAHIQLLQRACRISWHHWLST